MGEVVLLGSLDMFDLFRLGDHSTATPWLVALGAVSVLVLSLTRVPGANLVALAAGLLVGFIGGLAVFALVEDVEQADGSPSSPSAFFGRRFCVHPESDPTGGGSRRRFRFGSWLELEQG